MDTNVVTTPLVQETIAPERITAEHLFKKLSAAALAGMPAHLVASLLALGAGPGAVKIAGYRLKILGGPVICHSRQRLDDSHPINQNPEFRKWITVDRLKWALDLTPLPIGPTELAMVIHDASLEAPLGPDLSELYIWATQTAMFRIDPKNLEKFRDVPCRVAPDGEPEALLQDHALRLTYFGLCNEIQRKVERQAKQ